MLNLDDAMITVNARPVDPPPVSREMLQLRERHDFFLARAKTQFALRLRIRDLKMAATARRELAAYKRSNGVWATYERGYCVIKKVVVIGLMATVISASPLSWAKRHPKTMRAVSAAGMMSAGLLRSRGQRPNRPVGQLKAIMCAECRQVGR